MKRMCLMPKATAILAIAGGFALTCTACGSRKATREECTEMLDRYVDITSNDDETANMSPSAAHAAREMKKALRKAEPSYRRVHEQCEAEISKREYRCAMKAPTPETWQACID